MEKFEKKVQEDNDDNALKFALLYFINCSIFSGKKKSVSIQRFHFYLVKSGKYMKYPWGKKSFEDLIKSNSKKMDVSKKYYQMGGIPLALQMIFRNIVPNPKELSILELPSPFVEPHSVYPIANEADQLDDDFMDVQPHIPTAKEIEKVGDSSSPVNNKTKQQTAASPYSTRRQPRHIVKPSVKKMPFIQPLNKKDCGLFVAAYAKFLNGGEGIPNSSINIKLLCNRYASILWDYTMKKTEADFMSDDEAPPRKIRPIIDSSSIYRIVLS
ncbi:hypothetical protein HAX54_015570 [Datura stramonium]|uniref:DUF1985 domain-containing protein n=1 Tax=Datura stramonium TaxID=4076 RepID=A0ABS8RFW8_DATST|nr:hypothetical protein [Datura stramonium]